jgi:hypothetical protein
MASQLSDGFSFLSEIKFTFQPLGSETALEVPGVSDYERVDTTVRDPHTDEQYRLGGVVIERVHVTWQPSDSFGILAGRYLTPYGIWNVDHGTPVLITVRYPTIQMLALVPKAQTGLKLFGRFFPADTLFVDYAFTISNGRGPIDEIQDLDANKGLGLKLKLSYEHDELTVSVGGYGYWGDYTDIKRSITSVDPFSVAISQTVSYNELLASADFLLELFGVRLQAEYVGVRNRYSVRPLRSEYYPGGGYQPDHFAWCVYGLLGYTLPLQRWLGEMTLMPYFMSEYADIDD